MITSVDDLKRYAVADVRRYGGGTMSMVLRLPQVRWQLRLRVTEWWCNTHPGPAGRMVGAVLRQRLQAAGTRLGYTIPINVLGPGTRLPHIGTIVISGDARIGANCQILQGVTIGQHHGGAPQIASDVYLAPNAVLLGGISIGARAWIGAGSVVTKDVPPGEVWAGVPARCIRPAAATGSS